MKFAVKYGEFWEVYLILQDEESGSHYAILLSMFVKLANSYLL